MKKILFVLSILLAANFVFAEAKFMGIPFGISKDEAEKNKKSYEEKIQKTFPDYFYQIGLNFYYTEHEPKQLYGFSIRFLTDGAQCFDNLAKAFFLDNKFKQIDDNSFYNEDFVIYISNEYISVHERSKFNNAMKTVMK